VIVRILDRDGDPMTNWVETEGPCVVPLAKLLDGVRGNLEGLRLCTLEVRTS